MHNKLTANLMFNAVTSRISMFQTSIPQQLIFPESSLLERYDVRCPRYTSYPTAAELSETQDQNYLYNFKSVREKPFEPLSLYIHIPFCHDICYYCGCNKIVTKKSGEAANYIQYLIKEMQWISAEIGQRRTVTQLHFGGGTPTFLNGGELTLLMHQISQYFKLSDKSSREFSIEIDPRTVTSSSLALLKGLGFNRLSFGVQDFDITVQAAINRVNSAADLQALVEQSRDLGFQSINLELLYGLPLQTEMTLAITLEKVIAIKPDRIALYNYAHMPDLFKHQKALNKYPMPNAKEKTRLFKLAMNRLCDAGYKMIGLDHFVLETDELYNAKRHHKLQRNFQGYSIRKAGDLIGLGVSAISQGDRFIHQNSKKLNHYYQHLDKQMLPIEKSLFVNDEDLKRRYIIMPLMTQGYADIKAWESAFGESFSRYFHQEIQHLKQYSNDELIDLNTHFLTILPKGQYFIRQIANVFDQYRNKGSSQFSKAL